jgi:hypothetical protein
MDTQQGRWLLAICLLAVCAGLNRASAQILPPEAQAAGATWLLKACDVAEQDQLSAVLRKFKQQFEQFFLNALNDGPPPQLLTEQEAEASRRFDLRQEALKTGKGLGLSAAELRAARMITREQYLAREKEDFVISYRSRAVGGLGVVGGDKGKAVLVALAADQNSPLQGSAQQALLQLHAGAGNAKSRK